SHSGQGGPGMPGEAEGGTPGPTPDGALGQDPDGALSSRNGATGPARAAAAPGPQYKWIALSNTTLGVLMATINQSIVLIALPDIFRGIGLNPLSPDNTSYLLWMFMGFLVVSAVLVVSFGRLGDVFGPINWHLVFLVSAPIGAFGTVWAYFMLKDIGVRKHARMDWWGNILFATGLVAILVGITYGLLPYGGHPMGWTNPWVLTAIFGGIALLVVFGVVETKVAEPLFRLSLFKIRAFAA